MVNEEINDFEDILGKVYNKEKLIKKHLYLNIFLYDKSNYLKRTILWNNYGHEILQYDEDFYVRIEVVYQTVDKSILEYLSNDDNNTVRVHAIKRLKDLGYE